MPKAQTYIDSVLAYMLSQSGLKNETFNIYALRTARVQGMAAWGIYIDGTEVRITRGMFNMIYDEAELACLIGHEIGHVALHRKNQEEKPLITKGDKVKAADAAADIVLGGTQYKGVIKKQQKEILNTGWARNQEKEADKYGAELAAKAGYDPYAFCDLFERLASRVDLDFIYKFKKLEGSHPALDDRAKSLREHLEKKGYKEGEGKRNRAGYLEGMSEIFEIHTGEESKDGKKIQKGIDDQGKKDLKRLDEIFKEVEDLKKANKNISMEKFLGIMDEISAICQKYGVTADDIFGAVSADADGSFMEESIVQDLPFWEMFAGIKDAVAGKVGAILNTLAHIGVGFIPVVNDIADLYELFSGRDIFTGEKLSAAERALTALSLLIGSGSAWREVAGGTQKEASQMGLDGVKKSVDDAVSKIEKYTSKKSSGSAYDAAKSGEKYAKEYNNSLRQTNSELKKSIKSHQQVIDEHADKIANPEKYTPDFKQKTKLEQEGLIKKWTKDMERAEAYKDIKEGILIERSAIK